MPKPIEMPESVCNAPSVDEGDPNALAEIGRLDGHRVATDTGGGPLAAHNSVGAGPAVDAPDTEGELRQLAGDARSCADRLKADLQSVLGLSSGEATYQIRHGVRRLFNAQLQQIALLRGSTARGKAVHRFRTMLHEVGTVEGQIRQYALYFFERTQPGWSAEERERRAKDTELPELLDRLGHGDDAIQRYYEQLRVKREGEAQDALARLGLRPDSATRYVKGLAERRPDDYMFLLRELVDVWRNPRQNPLYARAGAQNTPESHEDKLTAKLDDLLLMRSAARKALCQARWCDTAIEARLRTCNRADLALIVAMAPSPSAPPHDEWLPGDLASGESGQEGEPHTVTAGHFLR